MNKIIYQIFFTVFLQFAGLLLLNGQQSQSIMTGEKVVLFSDRTLYIAGEQILFSAYLQTGTEPIQIENSRVLYCELIAPDGNKIAGYKYLIKNFTTSGKFAIPKDITTGIYYLKAYTKFMRNTGPSSYSYTSIKIVNATRSEVQSITDSIYLSESHPTEDNTVKPKDFFLITTDKSRYTTRDTVHISIGKTETNNSSWKVLSLSVVPEFSIAAKKVKLSDSIPSDKSVFYFPETKGLSITGKLIDKTTGNPLLRTRVNLSILGRGRDFMAMKTDSSGRFFFSLPDYTGSRDLFLSSENTKIQSPKILVDNDYCTLTVHIRSNIFKLTGDERKTVFKMAVNAQLESYFKNKSIDTSNYKGQDQAFYGKPNEILYIDNYVQLPSLEEYFNSLVGIAKVRKRQGEKYFKVLGTQSGLNDFEPLTLVDLVAVDDPSKVLAISPASISRIEVVNRLYVKGDQTYGGIINIITRHDDFGGIDLPSSGVFINYGFFEDSSCSQLILLTMPHSPDTRNTLFWEPKLELNRSNTAKITLTTSDTPGKYLIILNGIDTKGVAIRQTSAIEVIK